MTEGKEKAAAAKLDFDAKEATQKRAQEHLGTAREAVNEKHRYLLKTSSDDPLKVGTDDDHYIARSAKEPFWAAFRVWVFPQHLYVFLQTTHTHTRAPRTSEKVPPVNHP